MWHDKDEVIVALRRELDGRSLPAAADTVMLQPSLTLLDGDGTTDQARAVFQVAQDVDAALRLLVDGRWPDTMPTRVLVLPAAEAEAAPWVVETMAQIGVRVLLSKKASDASSPNVEAGEGLAFPGLDELLDDLD